ncbi:hypothetical protein BDA96_09G099800 [Sorghum bicolor]|uniref:Uncharacterized protein n=1 Tax=Sorghum bicolor TaxID=4558 RepID=A0A921QBX9_SORBI|nr:hypothetical protein BDA96_09G099800 [Sorghum bicolor]
MEQGYFWPSRCSLFDCIFHCKRRVVQGQRMDLSISDVVNLPSPVMARASRSRWLLQLGWL